MDMKLYWDNKHFKKSKVVLVTGPEGPQGCETSRLPYFLYTISSQMAVRLSALRAGHHLPPGSKTRVEAGSNTSTVTLRVVRGDEMGLEKAAP
jgi:hypothetical protein